MTGEERALARAALYRLLGLIYSYPARSAASELTAACDVAEVAAALTCDEVVEATAVVRDRLESAPPPRLEAQYQRIFTLSYSAECPLYETAFSASHLFQQTQQQADLSGFYRAFGIQVRGERPDHLSTELEFAYLLALKEAKARRDEDRDHWVVSRHAARAFLRDHLGRWGPLIANRVAVIGKGTVYEAASRLLIAFLTWETTFLRLGVVEPFRDEPMLIADEPGDFTCPIVSSMVEGLGESQRGAHDAA